MSEWCLIFFVVLIVLCLRVFVLLLVVFHGSGFSFLIFLMTFWMVSIAVTNCI